MLLYIKSLRGISLIWLMLMSFPVSGQTSATAITTDKQNHAREAQTADTAQRDLNKDKLMALLNEYRTRGALCGDEFFPAVSPLKWNDTIAMAAQAHSDDMFANDFYSHYGSDGSDPGERLHKAAYLWSAFGENIARSEWLTEERVVEGWIKSPGHCKNIMKAAFSETGIGRASGYWTQKLAHPRPPSRSGQRVRIHSIQAP